MDKGVTQPVSEVSAIEASPVAIRLTDVALETIQHNITMAQKLVTSVLEEDVDYGEIEGLQGKMLFDPGASKIMAAFNAYPRHTVIHHQEEEKLISWVIEASIISRDTQQVVGSGVGAASTRETKYRYRWVKDPQNYGYSPEAIRTLKNKANRATGEIYSWRIENPEYGELVHTLLAMAAKRAEVDATKNLPGVGSALKKLFEGKTTRREPDWSGFWSKAVQMGLSEAKVHELLQVKSMKDWLSRGDTLDDALRTLRVKLDQAHRQQGQGGSVVEDPTLGSTPEEDVALHTPDPGDEFFPLSDAEALDRCWIEIKSAAKSTKVTPVQLQGWFKQHQKFVPSLVEINGDKPPDGATLAMLNELRDNLKSYQRKMGA